MHTQLAAEDLAPPGDPAPEVLDDRIWVDGCWDFFHHGRSLYPSHAMMALSNMSRPCWCHVTSSSVGDGARGWHSFRRIDYGQQRSNSYDFGRAVLYAPKSSLMNPRLRIAMSCLALLLLTPVAGLLNLFLTLLMSLLSLGYLIMVASTLSMEMISPRTAAERIVIVMSRRRAASRSSNERQVSQQLIWWEECFYAHERTSSGP